MSRVIEIPEPDPLWITGVGLTCPVGHDHRAAAAAIRAGVSRFFEIPHFATKAGARVVGAFAYGLTDERSGSNRLLAMAIPAAQEALYGAEAFCRPLDLSSTRLLLSLGAEEVPRFEDFDESDLEMLTDECQIQPLGQTLETFRNGSAGGILALQRAASLLYAGEVRHCVVGAMDSLLEWPALNWFEEKGRLKTEDRSEGFIPGEAAAFVVVERRSVAQERGAPALAQVGVLAYGEEKASVLSDQPLRGIGLAEAIKSVTDLVGGELDMVLCDLNGEYYRMKEWALAMPRCMDGQKSLPPLWHPAESIGDVGATSALALVVIATAGFERGYFPGSKLLVWASSDAGGRGSALLGLPV
jgi:3-oxoacyl-[acyl-carrier-protein] synthase-1